VSSIGDDDILYLGCRPLFPRDFDTLFLRLLLPLRLFRPLTVLLNAVSSIEISCVCFCIWAPRHTYSIFTTALPGLE
jgi:hypothetical protein